MKALGKLLKRPTIVIWCDYQFTLKPFERKTFVKPVDGSPHSLLMKKGALLATLLLALATADGQVIEEWRVMLPSGVSIAVDSSGNVYAAGSVTVEGGQTNGFLRKYSTHGDILWENSIVQGPYSTGATCAGVDGSGNVYVFGAANLAGAFGGYGTDTFVQKVFVQKYTPIGNLAWTKSYGGETTICSPWRSYVDLEGNVLVACSEYVDMYDCKDTVKGSGGNNGCYGVILRYDTYGLGTEIKFYGRGNDRVSHCSQLFLDPTGAVYSQWGLSSWCSGAPDELYSGYALVKHGLTGGVLWQQVRGGMETPYENLAGVDREGNRYTLIGVGLDYHLRKYSPLNVLLWDAHQGDTGIGAVREDDEGNIFALSWHGYFVKYDSQGQEIWRSSGAGEQEQVISFDRFGLIHTGAACFDASGKALYCAYSNLYEPSGGMHVFGADARGCEYVVRRDYDQYYMCKFLYGRIISPAKGDLWISGEQDTVRWGASLGDAMIDIAYSEDDGVTYQPVASAVSADSLQYVWSIPATTAPKMKNKVKLKKAQQEITFAVSDVFGTKPYIVTRKDSSSGELVMYDYNKDRWGFANTKEEMWPNLYWYSRFTYNGGMDPFTGQPYPSWDASLPFAKSKDSDFPDWPSFVRAFTVDACYISIPLAVYSQRAALHWGSWRQPFVGSCFGISGTNALAFSKRESMLRRIPGLLIYDPIQVQSADTVIYTVTEYFSHQFGNPSVNNDLIGKEKTPTQTLRDLKEMLREEETQIRTLRIGCNNPPDKGYHSILAYWVEHAADDSPIWKVHVYDNSYPEVADPIIEVDTSRNNGDGSWTTMYGWAGWGGNRRFWLEVPSENYLSPPTLPKREVRQSPFGVPPGLVEIAGGRDASIRIRDGSGNVTGYAGGQVWSNIPGSTPLVVTNGSATPPYGYMLASGTYSITVDSFQAGESVLQFFTGSRALGYWRSGADSLQRDSFHYDTTGGGSLRVANPDGQGKSIGLKTILSEPGVEKVYTIYDMGISASDSALMGPFGSDGLKLVGHGQARDYTIRVEHASAGGLRVFSRANIPLTANTAHMITPEWAMLGGDLTVLVDNGNDGTVDDTLTLKNDLTGMEEHGSLIPGEYQLYQNYPNPFNPLTTIRYGLPGKSVVRLAVYNLLGQEVAVLVEGEKEAGYHEVRFDGSGLASGVYIYRLEATSAQISPAGWSDGSRAGTFVQTRKLLLLR